MEKVAVNSTVSTGLFAKRHVVFYTTCIPPASVSYARGQHGLHGARVMLSVGLMCMCCVCVCVRTRTHSACGVLGCESGCRDKTPGDPGRNQDVL